MEGEAYEANLAQLTRRRKGGIGRRQQRSWACGLGWVISELPAMTQRRDIPERVKEGIRVRDVIE